jgi:hypothetical protein
MSVLKREDYDELIRLYKQRSPRATFESQVQVTTSTGEPINTHPYLNFDLVAGMLASHAARPSRLNVALNQEQEQGSQHQ